MNNFDKLNEGQKAYIKTMLSSESNDAAKEILNAFR